MHTIPLLASPWHFDKYYEETNYDLEKGLGLHLHLASKKDEFISVYKIINNYILNLIRSSISSNFIIMQHLQIQ